MCFEGLSVPSGTQRDLKNTGWIVATALGSTAKNAAHYGKILPLGDPRFVVTADGIGTTQSGLFHRENISHIVDHSSVFAVELPKAEIWRQTAIDYDGKTIERDGQDFDFRAPNLTIAQDARRMVSIRITVNAANSRTLLMNENYRPSFDFSH